MKHNLFTLLFVLLIIALAGCTQSSAKSEVDYGEAQPLVDRALADLAETLDVEPEAIAVESVEAKNFSDTSLGVPEPGMMYAQVITPGYVVKLEVEGATYVYHGSGDRVVRAVPEAEDRGTERGKSEP